LVRGEKGTGKSAIYSLLTTRSEDFQKRKILLIPAERPIGTPVFRELLSNSPKTENEFKDLFAEELSEKAKLIAADCTIETDLEILIPENYVSSTRERLQLYSTLDNIHDEEGWTLLPNGKVLAVDAYVPIRPFPYIPAGKNSELYNPKTGSWRSAGSTVVQLWDSAAKCGGEKVASFELGPGVLRRDGTVFYTGSNSCGAAPTAIYNSYFGTWTPGPQFPGLLGISDGPAALEPNGKVLMMASPLVFQPPATFLEWDGRKLTEVPPAPNAANDTSYYGNFLVLPTGQIMFTDFYFVSVYNPQQNEDDFDAAWAPRVIFVPDRVRSGGSYVVSGFLFNGMSQGSAYGDDVQAATNYPLVRITNDATGHVFYSRTHGHSSMGVGPLVGLVSTNFDVPAGQEKGPSKLVVVANGIPSAPIRIVVR